MTSRPLLLDESAHLRLGPWLRSEGRDVTVVAIDFPASIDDREILAIAHRDGRRLVAQDTDFGELVVREGLPYAVVILLRLRVPSFQVQQARISHVLAVYADRLDRLLVVTDCDVRVR
jgi:predicted nuclease of predicted toxin-antitoxin system